MIQVSQSQENCRAIVFYLFYLQHAKTGANSLYAESFQNLYASMTGLAASVNLAASRQGRSGSLPKGQRVSNGSLQASKGQDEDEQDTFDWDSIL